jgi:lipopolysaccharide assembly protein A
MHKVLWLLRWILKAAIFFTLFAFALNNQHEVTAHFFFGNVWKTPLIVLVLIAFTAGVVIGVLGMVPRWWRHRRTARKFSARELASQQSTISPDSTQM